MDFLFDLQKNLNPLSADQQLLLILVKLPLFIRFSHQNFDLNHVQTWNPYKTVSVCRVIVSNQPTSAVTLIQTFRYNIGMR